MTGVHLTTDGRPAGLLAGVSIAPTYDEGRPRHLLGYALRCDVCGASWQATPSRGGTFTDHGLDRQARAHTCPPTDRKDTRP